MSDTATPQINIDYDSATKSYPSTTTPWGKADTAYRFTRGVTLYSTPGHGGFKLSAAHNAKVREALRNDHGWYEEDCEFFIVVNALPEVFGAENAAAAEREVKSWFPDQYEAATGIKVTAAESRKVAEREFRAAHAGDWIVNSARGSWADGVPEGKVEVTAKLGSSPRNDYYGQPAAPTKTFLVDAAAYAARSDFGYVIDLSTDVEVER